MMIWISDSVLNAKRKRMRAFSMTTADLNKNPHAHTEPNKNRFLSIRVNRKFCGFSVFGTKAKRRRKKQNSAENALRCERVLNGKNIWRIICNRQQAAGAGSEAHSVTCVFRSLKDWLRPREFAALLSARETTTFGCLQIPSSFLLLFRLFSAVKDDYYSPSFLFFSVASSSRARVCVSVCARFDCDARCNIYIAFCF